MNNPEIGAKATRQLTVTKNQLASSVGSGTVDVFATPMVAALLHATLPHVILKIFIQRLAPKFVYSIYVQQRKELP